MIDRALNSLGIKADALISTMGRHAARALELKLLTDNMDTWVGSNLTRQNQLIINSASLKLRMAWAFTEAPRDSLGHWISIDNFRIANYQAVVPPI